MKNNNKTTENRNLFLKSTKIMWSASIFNVCYSICHAIGPRILLIYLWSSNQSSVANGQWIFEIQHTHTHTTQLFALVCPKVNNKLIPCIIARTQPGIYTTYHTTIYVYIINFRCKLLRPPQEKIKKEIYKKKKINKYIASVWDILQQWNVDTRIVYCQKAYEWWL